MTGLLLKDFYLMKHNIKGMVLFTFFFGIVGWQDQSSQMMFAFIPVFTMLSISLFGYDENAHFDSFAMTLPIKKISFILEKIVFGILLALTGTLISIALLLIKSYFVFVPQEFIFKGILLAFFISLIALSISMPIFFKFKVEAARIYFIIFAMAFSFGSAFLVDKLALPAISFNTILLGLVILSIPSLVISVSVSLRIFKKKFE